MNESIKYILEAASLAPSADNTQPWKVSVDDDSLNLFHVPERDIAPYDSVPRGSFVAHGAFIENAKIAAASINKSLHTSLIEPGPSNSWQVAHLSINSRLGDQVPAYLYPQIKNRCTNRRPYRTEKISENQKKKLLKLGTPNKKIVILDFPQPQLTEAVSFTEQISFQNRYVHDALFENIRWSNEEAKDAHDGFLIDTFELPAAAKIVFKVARKWNRLDFFNKTIGLAGTLPKQVSQLYQQSGAFVGILGSANSFSDWIEVGGVMERVWLECSSLGISIQPIGAILFFKQGLDNKTTSIFSEEDRALISKACTEIQMSFLPKSSEQVLFIMRAGIAPLPSARTLRRPISTILFDES